MTTTVLVTAHCDKETTEVVVDIYEKSLTSGEVERSILQDGECYEYVVYDDRHLIVAERPKE